MELNWVCPSCRQPLNRQANAWLCPADDLRFPVVDGIADFLLPDRRAQVQAFLAHYGDIRNAERRQMPDGQAYRDLPNVPKADPHHAEWAIRAKTYDAFITHIVAPLEHQRGAMMAADLGAGNGWLSHRLAQRGHRVVAVDVSRDVHDGLGACRHYASEAIAPVVAEIDLLPLPAGCVDLVVFNAALHYVEDPMAAVTHAGRLLKPGGAMVVLDSPIYTERVAGEQMVRRRQDAAASTGSRVYSRFLVEDDLMAAVRDTGLRATWFTPHYGLRWRLRPWKRRLLGQPAPARFAIFAAWKPAHD